MKKTISMFIAVLLVLSLFIACGGDEETSSAAAVENAGTAENADSSQSASADKTELVYNGPERELIVNMYSAEALSQYYTDTFTRITERTDGKVTFVIYYSSSLLNPTETLDGLGTGMCDITDVTLNNFPERFVYTQQVTSYPFLPFTSLAQASDIMNDVIFDNDLMMNEFEAANIQPLFFIGTWGTSLALKNDMKIEGPESLKGLKLMSLDPTQSRFLADIGATPVGQPPTEYYSSMSNNVVDGIMQALFVINIFGALPLCETVYMFENSFNTGVRAMCVNNDVWNDFDETLRQIFMEEWQGEQLWNEALKNWAIMDQGHLDDAAENGIPIHYIEGEHMQVWRDALKPYGDAAMDKLKEEGYPEVDSVLDFWIESIENYDGDL